MRETIQGEGEGVQQSNSSIKEGNLYFHSSSLSFYLKHHTSWLDDKGTFLSHDTC